jgi:hypothetical protein
VQRLGYVIDARLHLATLQEQNLVQVAMPMGPDDPVVLPAARRDRLNVHHALVRRLQRLPIQKEGRHRNCGCAARGSNLVA